MTIAGKPSRSAAATSSDATRIIANDAALSSDEIGYDIGDPNRVTGPALTS